MQPNKSVSLPTNFKNQCWISVTLWLSFDRNPIPCLRVYGRWTEIWEHLRIDNTGQYTMVTQTFRILLLFFAFWTTTTLAETSQGFYPCPHESSTQSPKIHSSKWRKKKKSPARSLRMGPNAYFWEGGKELGWWRFWLQEARLKRRPTKGKMG